MKKISLTQGYVAIVDDDDYPLVSVYKWWIAKDHSKSSELIYARGWIPLSGRSDGKGREVRLHRLLMNVVDNPSVKIDHRNGDGLDNRRSNLRVASAAGNSRNRRHAGSKSGYKGVTKISANCYEAFLKVNRRRLYLGCYRTARDAALAYDNAARQHHGEFACLNLPEITDATPIRNVRRLR